MKAYGFAITLGLLISCGQQKVEDKQFSNKESIQQSTAANVQDSIPAGAFQETFEDKPGLVRVIMKEGLTMSQQGNYLNGKREGVWCEFHYNGLIKNSTAYVNGIKEGAYMEINPSGQLTKHYFYHNNIRHGEYKEFNHATLKEQRNYQNGKLEGLVKIFYNNGTLMEDGMYKSGLRDGISKWYDKNGAVSITYEYKNGELVKK